MKKYLSLLAFSLCLPGCASFSSRQTETGPDGTQRVTRVVVRTFMDGRSEVAKLRATTTDKTQGISLGSVSESSSSTNAVEILRHVAAILGAAK